MHSVISLGDDKDSHAKTFPWHRIENLLWCNILICSHFPIHIRGIYKWNTNWSMPLGCAVHHSACTTQCGGCTRMGKCFSCSFCGSGISCKIECYTCKWITLVEIISIWKEQNYECEKNILGSSASRNGRLLELNSHFRTILLLNHSKWQQNRAWSCHTSHNTPDGGVWNISSSKVDIFILRLATRVLSHFCYINIHGVN